ncbi:hypothetical protein KIN20_013688 [Parelaphostrongylus tenuis]|uniref:Mos1 transposase HTH domain-containing protein n=1 Tax=Parelaphostrongylus tenuis TaxID=148309 RepID=A0AAD5QNR1_PARTN|nr:hypothetical protein KIN20_013688 [Parelaphostrongylus tenuis]
MLGRVDSSTTGLMHTIGVIAENEGTFQISNRERLLNIPPQSFCHRSDTKLCKALNREAVDQRSAQRWFKKFREDDTNTSKSAATALLKRRQDNASPLSALIHNIRRYPQTAKRTSQHIE